jgi:hypothetical protein
MRRLFIVTVSLGVCLAPVASGQSLNDPSFEEQAVNIPTTPATSSAPVSPDSGWSGGGILTRNENPDHGWKVTVAGAVYVSIKERNILQQRFTVSRDTVVTLEWVDANRPSWRSTEWYGRPNDYRVVLVPPDGGAIELGAYTSQVGGGNAYSTPPGNQWWTEVGKRTWFTRSVPSISLPSGDYTLRFESMSPFYVGADGGLIADDRTTFLDDIRLIIFDGGGVDAGGLDAGGLDAGGLDAGGLDAGGLDAGGLDAGGVEFPIVVGPDGGVTSMRGEYAVGCSCRSGDQLAAWHILALPLFARRRRDGGRGAR